MTEHYPIRLLLLTDRRGRVVFIGGEPPSWSHPDEAHAEGWFMRVRRGVHQAYDKLRRQFSHQENVCSWLRHASEVHVIHSDELEWQKAHRHFQSFLDTRQRKHSIWRVIDTIAALFGALLTPLPGPNVFFFYPAARALSHHLAVRGVLRAKSLGVPVLEKDALLRKVEEHLSALDEVESEVQELEHRYEIQGLRRFLEKL